MEASLLSSGKSNAGSSATQNNGDAWKQQTTALGHKTHGADHGHRSMDDSRFFFGEEWELLDDAGNSLPRGVDERHLSPSIEDSSARFAEIVPETRMGMKEADRVNRKWEDAGKTHSFSVRGKTYLTVRSGTPRFMFVSVLCLHFIERTMYLTSSYGTPTEFWELIRTNLSFLEHKLT